MTDPIQTRPPAAARAIPPVIGLPSDSLPPLSRQAPVQQPARTAGIEPSTSTLLAPVPASRGSRKVSSRIAIVAALILGVALAIVISKQARSTENIGTETATAERKDFVSSLRLSGTVEAVKSRPIVAPRLAGAQLSSMIITALIPSGAHVKKGDLLAEFDRQAQMKDFLDKKASYEDFSDQVVEKQAAEDAARAKDETELKQAEDDLAKARLEVSKNDILSRIDAEKNNETLQQADATLKQLQETFKLKRRAAAAGIRTLEIQRDRARATMLYAQTNSQNMVVRAPMDGVAVLNTIYFGGARQMAEPQQGDQIWPGSAFMKVVDPSAMAVSAQVDEADLPSLHIGQHALIHLDAYPGMSFPGTLEELAPLGQTSQFSDKVRTFAALFSITGSNPKLMPDLSASVDAELANVKKAIVVPVESTRSTGGQEYVWIEFAGGFEKRSVKIGPENDLDAVIASGLNAGDIVRKNAATEIAEPR